MLDDRPDEFDHRNLFLHVLLGLVSTFGRLDALTTAPGTANASGAANAATSAPAVADDDPWLLCVLGLVAFRLRAMRHFDGIGPPPRPLAAERRAAPLPLRGLLR